ncbi:LIM and SH3 domain protein 1, partial [Corvus brachyrhynchos]
QFWHKSCFHCETCKMTLNMKNYKGYEKKPYCNAHYPKQSFTMVADTPENLRLKQQSELQSQGWTGMDRDAGGCLEMLGNAQGWTGMKEDAQGCPGMDRDAQGWTGMDRDAQGCTRMDRNTLGHSGMPRNTQGCPGMPRDTQGWTGIIRDTQGCPGMLVQLQHRDPPPQSYGYKEPAAPASTQRNAPAGGGKRFRAVYDYNAADEDEVSFQDGDTIINVQQIDDGWMYGTVERTGDTGMLPANYVEAI